MAQSEKQASQEFEVGRIAEIGIAALSGAFDMHNTLGQKNGLKQIAGKNRFGDIPFQGDVACEKAILKVLKEEKLTFDLYSEEHGVIKTAGSIPNYLVVTDGMDGSWVYENQFGKGPYATLLGIFKGADPTYNNWLFSGIMAHASKNLYYAVKDQGAFVLNLEDRITKQLHRIDTTQPDDPKWKKLFASTELDPAFGTTIVGDMVKKLPADFHILGGIRSAVACYMGLLTGERAGFLDGTRKDNLEMAAVYGLIRTVGGVVEMLDGREIGDQKYLRLGQGKTPIPIIIAASETFANQLINRVR